VMGRPRPVTKIVLPPTSKAGSTALPGLSYGRRGWQTRAVSLECKAAFRQVGEACSSDNFVLSKHFLRINVGLPLYFLRQRHLVLGGQ
jgi:hypothetical protein